MSRGSITLGAVAAHTAVVTVACSRCDRADGPDAGEAVEHKPDRLAPCNVGLAEDVHFYRLAAAFFITFEQANVRASSRETTAGKRSAGYLRPWRR